MTVSVAEPQIPDDEVQKRAIADAVWTDLLWLMPPGPYGHRDRAGRQGRGRSRPSAPCAGRRGALSRLLARRRSRPTGSMNRPAPAGAEAGPWRAVAGRVAGASCPAGRPSNPQGVRPWNS